ncbi:hypothetical protein [Extibacter muris]|nr:hypothetical protein [Extibacter muris]MCB6203879.1 hypothetical protein [Extibacter muris]MCQ4694957.1 hypothetical protein [Extibacter muris]
MRTILKVTSVLQIIGGILSIILAVLSIVGGGLLGAASSNASGLAQSAGVLTTGMLMVLGVIVLLGGIFSLVCGLFGLKGSNGSKGKLKAALVLGWISLVLSIVSVIGDIAGGADTKEMLSMVYSLLIPVLFVVSGTSVYKQTE